MAAPSISRLVVPIDVAALVAGDGDIHPPTGAPPAFARVFDRFEEMPWLNAAAQPMHEGPNLDSAVMPALFQDDDEALEPGVQLHWSLPDAIAHGTTGADGGMAFREAPNRWLVVRVATPPGAVGPSSTRAWIVESDRLWDMDDWKLTGHPAGLAPQSARSRQVPVAARPPSRGDPGFGQAPYRSIGAVFPFETWAEAEPGTAAYAAPHTAVGYGNVLYAATAQCCPNVFGLHDPLDDLPATPAGVSYLVAGWYAQPERDPLATIRYADGATEDQKRAQIASTYRWTFVADAGEPVPAATLCSGLLLGLQWDPRGRFIARSDRPVDVAVGNSTCEALSRLIAGQPQFAGQPFAEQLLNALQLGLVPQMDLPDGLAAIDDRLHERTFAPVAGGQTFVVRKPVAMADGSLHDIGQALDALNRQQLQCERLAAGLRARRGQVFADWYKYMMLRHTDEPVPGAASAGDRDAFVTDAQRFILGEANAITSDTALQAALAQRDRLRQALAGMLADGTVEAVAAPRFWQPNDPVLLFSGDDLAASARHGQAGRRDAQGNLVCRLSGKLVASMTAGSFVVAAAAVPGLVGTGGGRYRAELDALLRELFFLDPLQAPLLASRVAGLPGEGNPARADLAGFTARIAAAQLALRQGGAGDGSIAFGGTPPSAAGLQPWASPWIPLIMQWEAAYVARLPVGGDDPATRDQGYPADFIRSRFDLDPEQIELAPRTTPAIAWDQATTCQGMIVLTHGAAIDIQGQIDAYLQQFPHGPHADDLRAIRDQLRMPMMAQSMSGFHQALVMRRQRLQLPVGDPLATSVGGFLEDRFSNHAVPEAVDDQNGLAAVPVASYNPIRSGFGRVTRIRIVDAFGQVRDLDPGRLLRASTLAPHDPQAPAGVVEWPPRLAQPARLQLRWRCARDDRIEANSDPATTPIFGWALFNHLDKALAIYDAHGRARGALCLNGPVWQGAPGDDATYGRHDVDAAFAGAEGADAHLAAFARAVATHPAGRTFLADLLQAIDDTASGVEPPGSREDAAGLSVFIGRPLALARAWLGLELAAPPAPDQGWTAFRAAIDSDDGARRTADFEQVGIPVRLGDLGRVNDGLIGYFIETDPATSYQTFYAAASGPGGHGVVAPAFDQLAVKAAPGAAPLALTLLLDPRAPVHATTGMLPVKSVQIPPALYREAMDRIAVTFLTSPVLAPAAAQSLPVPVPRQPGYAWSWVTDAPDQGWTTVPVTDVNPRSAFANARLRLTEGWLRLAPDK